MGGFSIPDLPYPIYPTPSYFVSLPPFFSLFVEVVAYVPAS